MMRTRAGDRGRPGRDEGGFATITAVAILLVVTTVLALIGYLGSAVIARHRAQSAADLAALAAAGALVAGNGDPCEVAAELAARQDGGPSVASCEVAGMDVVVTVVVRVTLGDLGLRDAVARARAGPVE